ncbi:unnamed protein product, partial [marine sediment metagenome]
MKAILSCYTDLGNPSAPKGLEPEWLGLELMKKRELSKVICRGTSNKRPILLPKVYIVNPIPLGNKIPQTLTFVQQTASLFPSRYISQNYFFDYFAQKHIKDADVLVCEMPSLIRQMRAAKEQGMKTFVFATSAHISFVKKLMTKEYKKYGLEYKGDRLFEQNNIDSYKEADMIFARSRFTRMTLEKSGIPKNKIFHMPIQVFTDLNRFMPAKKKDDIFRAIYVGQ